MHVVERTGVYRLDTFWPVRDSPRQKRQRGRAGSRSQNPARRRKHAHKSDLSRRCTRVRDRHSDGRLQWADARRSTEFPGNGRGSFAFAQAFTNGQTGQSKSLPTLAIGAE